MIKESGCVSQKLGIVPTELGFDPKVVNVPIKPGISLTKAVKQGVRRPKQSIYTVTQTTHLQDITPTCQWNDSFLLRQRCLQTVQDKVVG